MIYKVYPSGKSQVAPSCYIYAPRFAPERIAVMRTTVALDDELLAEARELTGLKEKSGLIREALKALIERESREGSRGWAVASLKSRRRRGGGRIGRDPRRCVRMGQSFARP
jgi:Arc/MetJ family transcription regulator